MKVLLNSKANLAFVLIFTIVFGCNTIHKISGGNKIDDILGANNLTDLFKKPDPITTNFSDTKKDNILPNSFGNNKKFKRLSEQPRNENGGYMLQPGFYEIINKSYCLHAGTHGPSNGDGYLFAPLKGTKKDIIQAIIRSSSNKRNIPQATVQMLIWAVLAKTSFKNLSTELKIASTQLLTTKQLYELNGGALGLLPTSAIDKATESLPKPAKDAILLENKMRGLFEQGNSTYQDFERIAVIAGKAPNTKEYVSGAWSNHPNGYYVRYFPSSYKQTKVQVYVPQNKGTGYNNSNNIVSYASYKLDETIEYDGTNDVAVPANTGAQRLQQTNDPIDSGIDAGNSNTNTDGGTDANPNDKDKNSNCPEGGGGKIKTGGKVYALYKDKVLVCDYIGAGCSIAWFGNNPGAMRPSPTIQGTVPDKVIEGPNFKHNKKDVFAMFQTYQDGKNAIIASIKGSANYTILDKMKGYAPSTDGNDPTNYAEGIARKLGVPVTTKIKDLSDSQIKKMADAIEQREGYNDNSKGKSLSPDDPQLPSEIRDKYKNCK
jgi:hypothetical protein